MKKPAKPNLIYEAMKRVIDLLMQKNLFVLVHHVRKVYWLYVRSLQNRIFYGIFHKINDRIINKIFDENTIL